MFEKLYPARQVDELGRIVLPIELRKQMGIQDGDKMDITIKGSQIILTSSVARCVVCDITDPSENLNGKYLCKQCHSKLLA